MVLKCVLSLVPFHTYTCPQVAGADLIQFSDFVWYDGSKSGAYSSQYEVKLLALTLVNYGESIVDGKGTAMSLMQQVEADSIGYPGHNFRWQPPVSWIRQGRGILDNAKGMLTTVTSATGNGKSLQLIESATFALPFFTSPCPAVALSTTGDASWSAQNQSPRSHSTCLLSGINQGPRRAFPTCSRPSPAWSSTSGTS
jgi:hypothetical protein